MATNNPVKYSDLVESDALIKVANDARTAVAMLDALIEKTKIAAKENSKAASGASAKSEEDQIKVMQKKIEIIEQSDETHKEFIETKLALQKAQKLEKEAVEALSSPYKKLEKEYKDAAKTAKDLAAAEGIQSKAAKESAKTAKDLNDRLKAIDATLGNHHRSVGNYSLTLRGLRADFKNAAGITGVFDNQTESLRLFNAVAKSNPIAAIISAFILLRDKIKIISQAIDFFSDRMANVIQQLKDFGDWMGITAFAAEDKAERIKKAAELEQDAIKRRYELEKKLAELNGNDILAIERLQLLQRKKFLDRKLRNEQLNAEDLEKVTKELYETEDALIFNREQQRKRSKDSRLKEEKDQTAELIKEQKEREEKYKEFMEKFQQRTKEFFAGMAQVRADAYGEELRQMKEQQSKVITLMYQRFQEREKADDTEKKRMIKIMDQEMDDRIKRAKKGNKEALQELRDIAATDTLVAKEAKDALEDINKQKVENYKKMSAEIAKGITEAVKQQAQIQQQADQQEIERHKRLIEVQTELAAQGSDNILAEEIAAADKAESKKLQDAKKAAKQQETIALIDTFSRTLSASLKSGKPFIQAFGEALAAEGLVSAAFSKLLVGYKDGVEGIKGPGNETSDSIPTLLSKNESVITADATKENPGLATAMNKGTVDQYFDKVYRPQYNASNSSSSGYSEITRDERLVQVIDKKIETLIQTIEKKPVSQSNLDGLGEWTDRIRTENMDTFIHHKRSSMKPSLRLKG